MNIGLFKYTESYCPENYKCSRCGETNCRLWRQYNTFVDHIELLCSKCALKDQKLDGKFDEYGRFINKTDDFLPASYSIKWLVPAVPTEDGRTYWGYTSIPEDGFKWWLSLKL